MKFAPVLCAPIFCALVLTACSSPEPAPRQAPTTTTATSSTAPKKNHIVAPPDSYKTWTTVTDVSGISLSMPFKKEPTLESDGSRSHEVPLARSHGAYLEVSFSDTPIAQETVKVMATDIEKSWAEEGRTEIVASEVATAPRGGLTAVDYTLSFMEKGKKEILFVTAAATKKSYVMVMTSGAGAAAEGEPLVFLREYHKRMVDSIAAA